MGDVGIAPNGAGAGDSRTTRHAEALDLEREASAEELGRASDGLLSRSEAIRLAEVTPRGFADWEKGGQVHRIVKRGRDWYDRDEIELMRDARGEGTKTESAEDHLSRIVARQDAHIERLMGQNSKLIEAVTRPADVFTTKLVAALETLSARDKARDEEWIVNVRLTQELLNEQHHREIAQQREARGEERKDEAWKGLTRIAPTLWEQLLGTHSVAELVRSLDGGRLSFLLDDQGPDAFLSAKQKDLLRTAVTRFQKKKDSTDEKQVDPGNAHAGVAEGGDLGRSASAPEAGRGAESGGQGGTPGSSESTPGDATRERPKTDRRDRGKRRSK